VNGRSASTGSIWAASKRLAHVQVSPVGEPAGDEIAGLVGSVISQADHSLLDPAEERCELLAPQCINAE
jgi:hypothetical protein